jgi:dienelactone hydrolase
MDVTTETVRYEDGATHLTGFLARPEVDSGRGRVILVHGGAGLDEHAKTQADRYARLGYLVFACDMFGDGVAGNRERVMAAINTLRSDRAALRRRVDAATTVLEARAGEGRYAVIGYCFGGLVALEVARSGAEAAAVISIHGTLITSEPAKPGALTAKVLACHGALDPHVPMVDVTAFTMEMNDAGADWQLNIYGGAVHGFTHRNAVTAANGVAYDASADTRSFEATSRLLSEALVAPIGDAHRA